MCKCGFLKCKFALFNFRQMSWRKSWILWGRVVCVPLQWTPQTLYTNLRVRTTVKSTNWALWGVGLNLQSVRERQTTLWMLIFERPCVLASPKHQKHLDRQNSRTSKISSFSHLVFLNCWTKKYISTASQSDTEYV